MEYKELAEESGIHGWERVPTLGLEQARRCNVRTYLTLGLEQTRHSGISPPSVTPPCRPLTWPLRGCHSTVTPEQDFIEDLASAVVEALPRTALPVQSDINEGRPVSLRVVNDLVQLRTKEESIEYGPVNYEVGATPLGPVPSPTSTKATRGACIARLPRLLPSLAGRLARRARIVAQLVRRCGGWA